MAHDDKTGPTRGRTPRIIPQEPLLGGDLAPRQTRASPEVPAGDTYARTRRSRSEACRLSNHSRAPCGGHRGRLHCRRPPVAWHRSYSTRSRPSAGSLPEGSWAAHGGIYRASDRTACGAALPVLLVLLRAWLPAPRRPMARPPAPGSGTAGGNTGAVRFLTRRSESSGNRSLPLNG